MTNLSVLVQKKAEHANVEAQISAEAAERQSLINDITAPPETITQANVPMANSLWSRYQAPSPYSKTKITNYQKLKAAKVIIDAL